MALNGVADRPGRDLPGDHERLPGQRRRRVHEPHAGTNRVSAPGFDVDALAAYLGAGGPVGPGPQNRITRTG